MSKIHEIEKCMRCGDMVYPLIPSNYDGLHNLKEDIDRFIENPTKDEDVFLSVVTSLGMAHNEADITYYLCASCCFNLLAHLMRVAIAEDREILFRRLDGKGRVDNQ